VARASWDRSTDVVVVGSGAAGLTAALAARELGASVVVLDKSELIGGTTAVSGGGIWVPGNRRMVELGVADTREDALAYLRAVTDGRETDPALVEAYVDGVLEAVDFLEARTPASFVASRYFSDYFGELPGAKRLGRCMECLPFESRAELGPWHDRIRKSPHRPNLMIDEVAATAAATSGNTGAIALSSELRALAAARDAAGILTGGGALVASLLRALLDRATTVETQARVRRLVLDGERVAGVVAHAGGKDVAIQAGGVVLAAGGFEWNTEFVQAFLGIPDLRPLSPPVNDGDGLLLGMRAGAALANMTVAWSHPVTSDGQATFEGKPLHRMASPRNEAGCITVNRHGRRFVNEGVSYMDLARTFRTYDPVAAEYPNEPPVFMVFDRRVRDRIELHDLLPGGPTPAWVTEAESLTSLAERIGVPPETLGAEVARFNANVARGEDVDFHRGTVWFEGFSSGGPSPARALAPIDRPPFYAMALYDGALGTAGGLHIDGHGRVRASQGGTVEGLFAAGNTAASVFGPTYPAGGVTIGGALAFALRAGRGAGSEHQPSQGT